MTALNSPWSAPSRSKTGSQITVFNAQTDPIQAPRALRSVQHPPLLSSARCFCLYGEGQGAARALALRSISTSSESQSVFFRDPDTCSDRGLDAPSSGRAEVASPLTARANGHCPAALAPAPVPAAPHMSHPETFQEISHEIRAFHRR